MICLFYEKLKEGSVDPLIGAHSEQRHFLLNIFSLACFSECKFDCHIRDTDNEMAKQKNQLFLHRREIIGRARLSSSWRKWPGGRGAWTEQECVGWDSKWQWTPCWRLSVYGSATPLVIAHIRCWGLDWALWMSVPTRCSTTEIYAYIPAPYQTEQKSLAGCSHATKELSWRSVTEK